MTKLNSKEGNDPFRCATGQQRAEPDCQVALLSSAVPVQHIDVLHTSTNKVQASPRQLSWRAGTRRELWQMLIVLQ